MLRNPRLLQLFRHAPAQTHQGILRATLQRHFPGQLAHAAPSRATVIRPNLASYTTRTASPAKAVRTWRLQPLRGWRQARQNSTKTGGDEAGNQQNLSLSDRMKQMSRKYGWIVVGIYLGLSVLDFPFCFLAVRWFGTERIAELEHTIISGFWSVVEKVVPSLKDRRQEKEAIAQAAEEATKEGDGDGVVSTARGNGKHEDPSIWTQLLLAYGVHKSLIFFRIPITLAITPKVVKTLRKWGWNIGRPKPN